MGDLIVRLEAATGPDRELDGWIEVERDPARQTIVDQEPGRFPQKPIYGSIGIIMETIGGKDGADYINAPVYTASIDFAMTLIPEGYGVMMDDLGKVPVALFVKRHVDPLAAHFDAGDFSKGATLPLALCIAALRARQAAK